MELDRGTLARVDRKLLAGLGQDETYRMVRLPVSAAKWSTWKRYCESAGISMGRALAAMIDRELVSVFGDLSGDDLPVLAYKAEEELARREAAVARREGELDAAEKRLRSSNEHLYSRERELANRERRAELVLKLAGRPAADRTKVGRNERCPCGSGLKYKQCHGLVGR
ncbi:hypothetical protein BMS3Bbin01_02056 [bacterium BMS3Bbin01]|nr:hypothetical protein BMS3Bbin01_02056 [bacterium BMS3Bbin01]